MINVGDCKIVSLSLSLLLSLAVSFAPLVLSDSYSVEVCSVYLDWVEPSWATFDHISRSETKGVCNGLWGLEDFNVTCKVRKMRIGR